MGKKYKHITKEILEEMYITQCLNVEEIGKKLSVSGMTIWNYMYDFGIRRRGEYNKPKKHVNITREILKDLYITKGLNSNEIGKKLEVSGGLVLNYLKQFDIQIMSRSEARKKIWENPKHVEKQSKSHVGMYLGQPTEGKNNKYCNKYNTECKSSCREKWFHKCVLCGDKEKENERAYHTHHIDYNKEAGCDSYALRIILLCPRCHGKTNGKPGNQKKYQNILSHIYLLRQMIDELGYSKFDFKSVSELGSLDNPDMMYNYKKMIDHYSLSANIT